MTRIGVTFTPDHPPELLIEIARAAEHAGLDELVLWEDCFLEGGVSTATAALAATEHIGVTVALFPVPLRNVALTAMEIAGVARMFPGRFTPVLGHGVQDWMEQIGAKAASPLTLLREYTVALRSLLAGEEVTTSGRYVNLRAVELGWPPAEVPPLLVGAVGPKTLALAGQVGDGTVLVSGTNVDALRTAIGQIAAEGPHQIVQAVTVSFTGAEADVSGEPAAVAEAIGAWIEAGADTIVLEPTRTEPDLSGFVEQAGVVKELRG